MANTKLTKRKEEGDTQQVKPDSDSESELPQNQGNGDLVVDDLSHVHNKCDDLMAKLKALNQAVEDMPMASVISTSQTKTKQRPKFKKQELQLIEKIEKEKRKGVG